MIKAERKVTQQYLVHAVLGDEIGTIKNHRIVKFIRGDDAGFLVFDSNNIVVDMFTRTKYDFSIFENNFETIEDKLEEISGYLSI